MPILRLYTKIKVGSLTLVTLHKFVLNSPKRWILGQLLVLNYRISYQSKFKYVCTSFQCWSLMRDWLYCSLLVALCLINYPILYVSEPQMETYVFFHNWKSIGCMYIHVIHQEPKKKELHEYTNIHPILFQLWKTTYASICGSET